MYGAASIPRGGGGIQVTRVRACVGVHVRVGARMRVFLFYQKICPPHKANLSMT